MVIYSTNTAASCELFIMAKSTTNIMLALFYSHNIIFDTFGASYNQINTRSNFQKLTISFLKFSISSFRTWKGVAEKMKISSIFCIAAAVNGE